MANFKSIWDYELLWNKTKVYAQKALDEDRESTMFPFWSALTLEYLGRATLSKVHPVLVADPRDGENILYVFGYSKSQYSPKSVMASTIFDRCSKIVPDFTKKEIDNCLALINRRNEELHSGSAAFEEFSTKLWLADYYKVCKLLLNFANLELSDLFGVKESAAAEEMITEANNELVIQIKKRLKKFTEAFEKLSKASKQIKQENGSEKAKIIYTNNSKNEKCICCGALGLTNGKIISVSEAKLIEGEIVQEIVILPTEFNCFSCGLNLNSHQEMNIADYGGQFTKKEYWDPAEYHGIETYDPSDYYDYGND